MFGGIIIGIIGFIVLSCVMLMYLDGVFDFTWELIEENVDLTERSYNYMYDQYTERKVKGDVYRRQKTNGIYKYKYVKR